LVVELLEPITSGTQSQIKAIEKMCRKRLDKNPFDLDAMFTLAAVMARMGSLDLAIVMVEGLLAVNPEYPGGMRLLAKLHKMQGNNEKWKECMEKAATVSEV
jgi:predicted Zn-dependent protease